jgi:hypothetical protein
MPLTAAFFCAVTAPWRRRCDIVLTEGSRHLRDYKLISLALF